MKPSNTNILNYTHIWQAMREPTEEMDKNSPSQTAVLTISVKYDTSK
jgi:hypothetical protein